MNELDQIAELVAHKQWNKAFAKARSFAEVHPDEPQIHSELSRIGLKIGRPDVTIAASHNLSRLTDLNYVDLRRWTKAASRLGDASEVRVAISALLRCESTPVNRLPGYFELAKKFRDDRSADLILQRLKGPRRITVEALELELHGESGKALDHLEMGMDAYPNHSALWVESGRLRMENGDAQSARSDLATALNLDPNAGRAQRLYDHAVVLTDSDEALAAYLDLQLQAEQPSAYIFSTRLEQLLIGGDTDGALKLIDRGLQVDPANLQLRRSRPLTLARAGHAEQAVAAAADLVQIEENSAEALLVEGQVHRTVGERPRQLENLNEVLALDELAPLMSTANDDHLLPQFLRSATDLPGSTMSDHISVVMTVFGLDDMLPNAIDSILEQTHRSVELIVVDDCSPDNTFEYLQERSRLDSRLRPFRMPTNGGTYRAKNFGLLRSSGEFVTFMDSDDYSHPQRLEVQLRAFKNNPELAVVSHWHVRVDDNSDLLFKRGQPLRLAHISPMIPRHVLDAVGYFDRVRVAADSEYIARIETLFGPSRHLQVKSPLMVVASHAASLTGGGPFHMSWRGFSGVRAQYVVGYRDWHHKVRLGRELGYMPYIPSERLFPAPDLMLT